MICPNYICILLQCFSTGVYDGCKTRSIADPDSRVVDRIYNLEKNEIGFQKIISVKNGSNNLTFFKRDHFRFF